MQRVISSNSQKNAPFTQDWADIQRKSAEWTFAAAQYLKHKSPFEHYSSADYVNPGDAETDFIDTLKRRYNSNGNLLERSTSVTAVRSMSPRQLGLHGERAELDATGKEHETAVLWSAASDKKASEDEQIQRQMLRLLFSYQGSVYGPPIDIEAPARWSAAFGHLPTGPSAPSRVQDTGTYELSGDTIHDNVKKAASRRGRSRYL